MVDRSLAGRRVHLEVGCGATVEAPVAAEVVHVGIDRDLEVLDRSTGTAVGWNLVCGDAMMLPFRDGGCTSITLRAVLHHLAPTTDAVAELARSLKPGGTLTVIDGEALEAGEARRLHQELVAAGLPIEPVAGFDLDELRAVVTDAGLDVESLATGGTATFATPPYVSRHYTSKRFVLTAVRR